MRVTKNIFGKNYTFECDDAFELILRSSVDLYPEGDESNKEVFVKIDNNLLNENVIAQNPAEFRKSENSIVTKSFKGNVLWKLDDKGKLSITLFYQKNRENLLKLVRKLRSMEYPTEIETFQQVLHEVILIPSVYFFNDRAVIHSSAFSIRGKGIMLAGTGGVGKTSAALSLRKKSDASFVADDIVVISADGYIFPNLAWPKIYGYNISSYITTGELLEGRGFLDRVQFSFKNYKNPRTVRRKISPDKLFLNYLSSSIKLDKVFYLFRDNSNEIHVTKLDKHNAIRMGIHIMKTEYSRIFHNYIEWDNYNSLALGLNKFLDLDIVFRNWETTLEQAFEKIDLNLVHIPLNIKHESYLEQIHKYIL